MKILVYGAGVIGSVYAAYLHRAGHAISVLARGRRLAQIREHGILLESATSEERIEAAVPAVEQLEPGEAFDLVLVVMQKGHLPGVLPTLAKHTGTPAVAFVGNNAAGPDMLVDALGAARVLMGFPDFGGYFEGPVVRFTNQSGDTRRLVLTLGELDGSTTPRLRAIAQAMDAAGIDVEIEPHIDAWLKGHAAMVVPILFGLDRHDLDNRALARDRATLGLMVRAVRDGLRALRALGYPITPAKLASFLWLPTFLSRFVFTKVIASDFAQVAFAGHAASASAEFELVYRELRAAIEKSGVPTPALDELCGAGTLGSGAS